MDPARQGSPASPASFQRPQPGPSGGSSSRFPPGSLSSSSATLLSCLLLAPSIQCPQTTFLLNSSPVCPVADSSSPDLSQRKLILQLSKSKCMISTPHSLNSVIATKVYPAAHARKPRVVLNFSISLPIQALSIPPPKYLPNPSAALYSQNQRPGPSHRHVPRGALVSTLARFF